MAGQFRRSRPAAACQGHRSASSTPPSIPHPPPFAGGQARGHPPSPTQRWSESGKQHGTAVAALIAGARGADTPGLLPGARIVAVDAFYKGGRRDDRSGVYELLRALDLLAQRRVRVANMSLAGPPNILLDNGWSGSLFI